MKLEPYKHAIYEILMDKLIHHYLRNKKLNRIK